MKKTLYQTIIMHSGSGFALLEIEPDNSGNPFDYLFLEVNESFEKYCHLKSDAIQGKKIKEIRQDSNIRLPDWFNSLYERIKSDVSDDEFEFFSTDLKKRFKIHHYRHEKNYLSIHIEDISDHKELNDELNEYSQNHHFLLENMPQGVVYHNSEGKIIFANQSAARILGITLDQLYGKTSLDPRWRAIHEDGSDYMGEFHPAMMTIRTGKAIQNSVMGVYNYQDDSYRWININSIPKFKLNQKKPYQVIVTFEDITDRIQLEKSLKESEANLKATIENSVENIWSIDTNYNIRYINEVFVKSFNQTFGVVLSKGVNVIDSLPDILRPVWKKRYDRALRNEQFTETDQIDTGETSIYIEISMNPIVIGGEVVGVSCYGKDITEQKETEKSLLIFKESHENSLDAIGMSTPEWKHYYQNKAFDEIFGIIGRNPSDVYLDQNIGDEVYRTIMSGKKWEGELKMYDKNKNIRDIFLRAYASKDEKGNITSLVGIHTDITERKNAENEIIEKNVFIHSMLNAVPVAVFYKDNLGHYLGCNDVFSEIMGVTSEEILGKTVYELWPSDLAEIYHQKDLELLQNPVKQKYEYQVEDRYGITRPVIYAKDVFYDAVGNVAGLVGAFVDISDIKNAEQKVLKSEANLKAIIENSLESIWSVDTNYKIQYVNEVFAQSYQESFGVFLKEGMDIVKNTPDSIRKIWKERYDRVFKNEHFIFEDRIATDVGNVYIEVAMNPIVVDGKVTGASAYGKNVTEQKLAEESLKQSLERNMALLDANPDIMFVFDRNYRFVDYHAENENQLLIKPEIFMGKSAGDILSPELAQICRKNVDIVIQTGKQSYDTYEIEIEGIKEYYESRYVLCGKNEVMSIVRNITARKIAEDALIKSEEKYRLLAENITDVIWTMDLNGKYHYVSPSVFAMRGFTPEENMKQSFDETLTPESAKIAHKLFAEAVDEISSKTKPEPQTLVLEQTCKDGSTVWTEIMMSGVYDQEDNFKYFLGVTRDISLRKKAEDELIKQSELRQLFVDISTGYINLPLEHIEQSIKDSLEKIAKFSNADRSYIFDFDDQTEFCTNTHEWCNENVESQIEVLQNIVLAKEWVESFRKGDSVYIPDIKELPESYIRSILEPQNIKSLIVVPMMNQELCIGFVGFDYVSKYHEYSHFEQQLLLVFAEMLVNIKLKKQSVEELIEAKEAAEENEKRLTQIADNLSKGMIYQIVSEGENERHFTYISNKVEEFYGCTIEEAKSDSNLIYGRIHKEDLQSVIQGELEALRNFSVFHTFVRMINPDGSIRWSYFVSSPRMQNEKIMWDGIEIDVTQQKQIENELIAAKEKAEESDRLKSVFLANVSHEIRTPMNAILGFLGLLKEPDLNPTRINNYIEIVNQSGQRLLNTINDIIEISKIESGQSEVLTSVVYIPDVMHFHYEFFRQQADKKGIQLNLSNYMSGKNAYILTDRNKLDGILTNLINNAIKFTIEGSIEFGNYQDNDQIVFFVKDTGIGIPIDRKAAIFERFVQADINNTRPHEGSGLGLSIVKAYVEMLNGEIDLESEVGKGTIFKFKIPYILAEAMSKSADLTDKTVGIQHHRDTLLIAEDDDFSFMFFEDILKNEGINIIRATNGDEVVKFLKENEEVSLILMDIKMPGTDGLEATRQIRQFNKKIPIIAQTAYAIAGDKEKAMDAGCNDYISKPIKLSELIKLLNKYL